MIRSFQSKPLKLFWEKSDGRKLPAQSLKRIEMLLDFLNKAKKPRDMDVPGFKFHQLKGNLKHRYAVWVTANWRMTFAWDDEDAIQVDYEDYH